MLVLALETSDLAGSVALLEEREVLEYIPLDAGKRSARWRGPAIDQALTSAGRQPRDIQLVAVTTGPGSFTGLRVGVTTGKTLAYVVGCPVIGVNTLEAIALRAPATQKQVWAVIDAQRSQLFTARFDRREPSAAEVIDRTAIASYDDWLAKLSPADLLTGPGLQKLTDRLPTGVEIAQPDLWPARAIEVGLLGLAAFSQGQQDDPFSLVPQYFRPTAAEEQWARKNAPPAA